MLAPEMVERIRRLLADGRMSQRAVAREVKVSRGTVEAIAHGRRPDYPERLGRQPAGLDSAAGPQERCPGCGAMVRMPCRACLVRTLRERRRRPT